MNKYSFNQYYKKNPEWQDTECYSFCNTDIFDFHKSLSGYRPTSLVELPALAKKLDLGKIYVKDESERFGIKAFKALGASYAIFRFLKNQWESKFNTPFDINNFNDKNQMEKLGKFTFCAATDGNHGRAVAWTAKKLNQKAVIYMPDNTVKSRIDNIKTENGEVILVDGTFDDCVERAAKDAKDNNWIAISDTAYSGYLEIPGYIMAGYSSIFRELEDKINFTDKTDIDFVFLQAGVGGLAAAGTWYYTSKYKENRPKIICVEPIESDCFLESVTNGKEGLPKATKGNQQSIMAGLNCGVPSLVAWPIIRDGIDFFMAIDDDYAVKAIRNYYHSEDGDKRIISGESGAAGLAGLLALLEDNDFEPARKKLGLNKSSKILIINTEGDTDPVNFDKIINSKN